MKNITNVLFLAFTFAFTFFRINLMYFVKKTENAPANNPIITGIHKSVSSRTMGAKLSNKSALIPSVDDKNLTDIIEKHTLAPETIISIGESL